MSDEFTTFDQRAVIKVCGIGGGGGNAVGRMIEAGMKDVEFITINTDAQVLRHSPAGTRLQIGIQITGGLGSGAKPEIGQKAALEDRERIAEVLRGADMVFLTAGLGGGTGTGATPIVAEVARSTGALTVGIVTLPFSFEGNERMLNAQRGLAGLEEQVDALIVVPNDRVAALCQHSNMSFLNAFRQADEVLHNGVRAISEVITVPGLINVDFADVRTIMQTRGRTLMGIGSAEGEQRAVRAASEAIVCPLLDQSSIDGAKGVIVNIKGGCDLAMREVLDAVTTVKKAAHPDANIIFGAVVDEAERPELQVTVIAAGFQRTATESAGSFEMPEEASAEPTKEEARMAVQPMAELPARPAAAQVQYLFPEEDVPAIQPVASYPPSDPDEDLGIPAFMRKRKKKA
ncbi:MAG: cell division protein FtsZ [Candidatus Hydrogenedentes bacterium]|nr:cell division protein FtsZ [Candidatus Hydrogenedentota bacterium]